MQGFGWSVETVWSARFGEKIPAEVKSWRGDYIICFRSFFILKNDLITRAAKAAVNFHPGPPNYRGTGCLNNALYNDEKQFGVTCHYIDEEVDHGKIIDVDYFEILPGDGVDALLARTHEKLYELAARTLDGIHQEGDALLTALADKNATIAWSGEVGTRKALNAQQVVGPDISEDELSRKIRAFHTDAFPLKLNLYGRIFVLQPGEAEE